MIIISKVNIKYTIITDEKILTEKRSSIFNNGIFTYKEDDNTLVKFDIKKELLERENNDIIIKYDYSNEKAHIFIKSLNKELYPSIIIHEKEITKDNINIKFSIEDTIINYKIEVLK